MNKIFTSTKFKKRFVKLKTEVKSAKFFYKIKKSGELFLLVISDTGKCQ